VEQPEKRAREILQTIWEDKRYTRSRVRNSDGESETIYKPSFIENMRFFFSYQLGHMYVRYFLWNFSGRQNDIESQGEPENGNWITGINFS